MTVPGGKLRELADKATPGPWVWEDENLRGTTAGIFPNGWVAWADAPHATSHPGWIYVEDADARLIALAPDLAVLCADMGDALKNADPPFGSIDNSVTWRETRDELLARLAQLEDSL